MAQAPSGDGASRFSSVPIYPSRACRANPWDSRVLSAKLLALDVLWRHQMHESDAPGQAAETALQAAAALRHVPAAWQRAVVLSLKALACQGRWDECWRLAATELAFRSSREVLYQCGRLSYFDGRHEAIDAYLPHLCGLLPVTPDGARADVQFWIGMMHHKRGHILLAIRSLQAATPLLQSAGAAEHLKKLARADAIVATVAKLEVEVHRIFDFCNAVWKMAAKRHKRNQRWHCPDLEKLAAAIGVQPIFDMNGTARDHADDQLDGCTDNAENGESEFEGKDFWGDQDAFENMSRSKDFSEDPRSAAQLPRAATLMSELSTSISSAPWKIFGFWRGLHAATAVDTQDTFLGALCRGRLALVRGNASEAEGIWQVATRQYPLRLEPYVELWCLRSSQGAHKKAVLDIRRGVELVGKGRSDWGKYVRVDVDVLLDDKVWTGAGSTIDMQCVVHLLLAKSLARCRLWEDAYVALADGNRTKGDLAPAAFMYQMGKLCAKYLQELLAEHLRKCQCQRDACDRLESSSPDEPGGEEEEQEDEVHFVLDECDNSRNAGTDRGNVAHFTKECSSLEKWLERGHTHMQAFLENARNDDDRRKGFYYQGRLDLCRQIITNLKSS